MVCSPACAAFVVLRAGCKVDEEGLREHCRARLARFKVPKTFTLVDALPRSSMGKVLKDDLRGSVTGIAR